MSQTKKCSTCPTSEAEKPLSCFSWIKSKNKYRDQCRDCIRKQQNKYYQTNYDHLYEKHREYVADNKEHLLENRRVYEKDKKQKDASYALRQSISISIIYQLKKNGAAKFGRSIFDFLPYNFQNFKNYLESLFEFWMTWNNWGRYNSKTWDDDDSSTWVWQIDHIIPQSDLPYNSMEHPNFLKCWALDNLRPLSAKRNVIEGSARTRHKSKSLNT